MKITSRVKASNGEAFGCAHDAPERLAAVEHLAEAIGWGAKKIVVTDEDGDRWIYKIQGTPGGSGVVF